MRGRMWGGLPNSQPSSSMVCLMKGKRTVRITQLWALKKVLPLIKNWGLSLQSHLSRPQSTSPDSRCEQTSAWRYPTGGTSGVGVRRDAGIENVEEVRQDHLRLQNDLAKLSVNTRQVMVSDSGHEIDLYEPDVFVRSISEWFCLQ
jgi:hypothetical protein